MSSSFSSSSSSSPSTSRSSPPFSRARKRVQVTCKGGRTKQSFKNECDVNRILANYRKTGLLTHVQQHQGKYGDFTHAVPYHEAYQQVLLAQDMFASLPAAVRAVFNNDAGQFLAFADNPANFDAMVEMGLAPKPQAPTEPDPVAIQAEEGSGGKPPKAAKKAPPGEPLSV